MHIVSVSLALTFIAGLSVADEKPLLDVQELPPSCYYPDPFNIGECFESCLDEGHLNGHWDVALQEVDFDAQLDATIFSYLVTVWESGVCSLTHDLQSDSVDDGKNAMDEQEDIDIDPTGIEGVYIFFNGCCNHTLPSAMTKAITPKLKFEFLAGGWYWRTMIMPGYENVFGFMIHGDVELTTGTYCVRTNYHCVCEDIVVPDLCNSQWQSDDTEWAKQDVHGEYKSVVDSQEIWSKPVVK